jgi:hypothetical protein
LTESKDIQHVYPENYEYFWCYISPNVMKTLLNELTNLKTELN